MHVRVAMIAALGLASSSAIAAGCTASDGGAEVEVTPDASTTFEGGSADGGADAPADAKDASVADARACSDQGFCHAALPKGATLRDVWGDGTVVWAVSEEGDVLRWDGQAWIVHASKLGALYAIWGSGPTDVWIGGARGLHHGTGASPQSLVFAHVDAPGDPSVPILSIWGTGPDDVLAVGGFVDDVDFLPHGRVLRRRSGGDAGVSWKLEAISSEPFVFRRVWGSAASGAWIAGDDGSDNAQSSAVYTRPPAASTLRAVTIDAFAPDEGPEQGVPGGITGGGIAADGRTLVIGKTKSGTPSLWYGASADAGDAGSFAWSYEARDLNDPRLRVVWAGGTTTWLAGDYGRLRSSSGGPWMQAAIMIADLPIIQPLHAIWGKAPDDFWVVGKDIAMHRTTGGKP